MKSRKSWRIGITDHVVAPAEIEQAAFPEAEFVFLKDWHRDPAAEEAWAEVDAVLVWHWHIDAMTLDRLKKCKVVVRYGVGYDLVDVDELLRRKMPVCNTPDYGTEEVADTACALVLSLVRKVPEYDRVCRTYTRGWQDNPLKPHHRTGNLTLGIVGVGRIGTAVINRLRAFGFRILGYDPYQPSGHEKAIGYTRVHHLEALLKESDVVSLHCPLSSETKGMVDDAFLKAMKPGAILINTARGGLLKGLDPLERALRSGQVWSVGFDVLPTEPPRAHTLVEAWRNDEHWIRGRMLVTPHTGFYSEEAWYEMRYKAAETARIFLVEGRLRNQILS